MLTSAVPYFLIMGLLALTAWGVAHLVPFYRQVSLPSADRYASLDGLRGFLALGVFFHHTIFSYLYFTHGHWEIPPDASLYILLGKGAVYLFFMMTGFLFWSKALASEGHVDARRLYLNRVRRLYPMYLCFLAVVLVVLGVVAGGRLREPAGVVAWQVIRWLTFGLVNFPEINGSWGLFPGGGKDVMGAGVAWTLRFEWMFYLTLPLLANGPVSLVRKERFLLAVLGVLGVYLGAFFLTQRKDPKEFAHLANFMFGMTAAYLLRERPTLALARRWWFGLVPAGALVGVVWAFPTLDTPGSLAVRLLLAVAFVSFLYGNTLFGLLTTRWARVLGTVSYSIYLLHGVVLFLGLTLLNHFRPIATMGVMEYWAWIAPIGVVAVLVACVTYRWLEHPFLSSGGRPATRPEETATRPETVAP